MIWVARVEEPSKEIGFTVTPGWAALKFSASSVKDAVSEAAAKIVSSPERVDAVSAGAVDDGEGDPAAQPESTRRERAAILVMVSARDLVDRLAGVDLLDLADWAER